MQIAAVVRAAYARRGSAYIAVSGGSTPWHMLEILAQQALPFSHVHIFQVDERFAPPGSTERNFTHLSRILANVIPMENLHAMPVERGDTTDAVHAYQELLRKIAGVPPTLDLVHLGLGADGHTASLFADDQALKVTKEDVTITGLVRQGFRRMTLTLPMINRAKNILWIITGQGKDTALKNLIDQRGNTPATLINTHNAWLYTCLGSCAT
jgi:6-phosphogluconolactonase